MGHGMKWSHAKAATATRTSPAIPVTFASRKIFVVPKPVQRAQLEKAVEQFLANGGRIRKVRHGTSRP